MISDYLNKYFKDNEISQTLIARKTSIARSKVNLSLNNKRKFTADELMNIAIVFDINLEDIKKEIKSVAKLKP